LLLRLAAIFKLGAVAFQLRRLPLDFRIASLQLCTLWITPVVPVLSSLLVPVCRICVDIRGAAMPVAIGPHSPIIPNREGFNPCSRAYLSAGAVRCG